MAVEHMVWFKFREDVPQARRDELAKALRALPTVIPEILRLHVGFNFTERARGCQMGLIVTFESKESLGVYDVHPEHVAVAKQLRADCSEILAFDFERD